MTTEIMGYRPLLRSDLVIEKQEEGKTRRYLIVDPASQRYFQCGDVQYALLALFTGEFTHAEIIERYSQRMHIPLRADQLDAALRKLEELSFLVHQEALNPGVEPTPAVLVQRRPVQWRFSKRWRFFPVHRIFQPLGAHTGWLFTLPSFTCCVFLALATWWIMIHGGWNQAIAPVLIGLYIHPSLSTWEAFLFAILITASIHESAHALALQHFGQKPGYFGVGIAFPVGIFVYAEIGEVWRLPRQRQRIIVTLAGPLASLVVGAAGALAWWVLPFNILWSPWLAAFMASGITTALFNVIPFFRTDGYFVLADWVGIP
ncbi:MAG: hypothetical protein ACRDHW_03360, partial [Ktedonobacteraceae bacterium]